MDDNFIINVNSEWLDKSEIKKMEKSLAKIRVIGEFTDGGDNFSYWSLTGSAENLVNALNTYWNNWKDYIYELFDNPEELKNIVSPDEYEELMKQIEE